MGQSYCLVRHLNLLSHRFVARTCTKVDTSLPLFNQLRVTKESRGLASCLVYIQYCILYMDALGTKKQQRKRWARTSLGATISDRSVVTVSGA